MSYVAGSKSVTARPYVRPGCETSTALEATPSLSDKNHFVPAEAAADIDDSIMGDACISIIICDGERYGLHTGDNYRKLTGPLVSYRCDAWLCRFQ